MTYLFIAFFVFVLPIIFLALSKKRTLPKATPPEVAEPVKSQAQIEREERERQRAEWESKHGRIVTALAGVTFDNEDGTSRQKLLKDYMARKTDAHMTLEEFKYKGEPAVRVLIDGKCVGNVPRSHVAEVLDVMDRLENGHLDVEIFYPEDAEDDEEGRARRRGEKIYRADLTLIYAK